MRPIKLSIAGLHSFRDKQTVDFEALCEGGVFGIFGPTGSGKSSLLDAMTLALYGKVERASNNTQGIMNHAEDMLSVSFLFQLRNKGGAKRYTVERTFKRAGDFNVKTSISRLLDVTDPESTIVLADKTGEVNQQILRLLGLTIDDFTRAVVLPQGKFAEFLSLKGTERRQMLQRLFNLEQYGDMLNKKIRGRLADKRMALEKIIAEQAGLGDASDEAVAQAAAELQQAEASLVEKTNELERLEQEFEQKKLLWELQRERDKISAELADEQKREQEITNLKEMLERAETADQLRPYLEEYESAVQSFAESEQKRDAAEALKTQHERSYTAAEENYKMHKQNREKEEPILMIKRERLQQAVETEKEKEALQNELLQLQKQLEQSQTAVTQIEKEIAELTSKYERGIARQQQIKNDLKTLTVSAEQRKKLTKAAYERNEISVMLSAVHELKDEVERKKSVQKKLEQEHVLLHEDYKKQEQQLSNLFRQLEKRYHEASERIVEAEKLERLVQVTVDNHKHELEAARSEALAAELAGALVEGDACPVCGSKHHPNLAVESETNLLALKEEVTRLQEQISVINSISTELKQTQVKLEQRSARIVDHLNPEAIPKSNEIETIESIFPEDVELDRPAEVKLKGLIAKLKAEHKALYQDYLQIDEKIEALIPVFRKTKEDLQQANHAISELNKDMNHQNNKLASLSEDSEKLMKEWEHLYTDFSFAEIDKAQEQLQQQDDQAEELKESLDKSITYLDKWEDELKSLQQSVTDKKMEVAKKQTEAVHKQEWYNKLTQKLLEEAQGEEPFQQLERTNAQLEQLKRLYDESYTAFEQAQQLLRKSEQDLAVNTQSFQEIKVRLQTVTEKWEKQLLLTAFERISDVKVARTEKAQQLSWREQIEKYTEKIKQLKRDSAAINAKLGDSVVTNEQWDEMITSKETAKEKANEAREEKGKAERSLYLLKENHQRYQELEKDSKRTNAELEKLTKLQQVFRGNQFVEYIAEEQLIQVSLNASEFLGELTRQRYALEVDSNGGFIIRDDANGGVKRPVSTLSGGETFLTSLSLALALSAQIQLRGEYPLEFFFLDEGFGTLDQELLDTVLTALEKLQTNSLAIGVISHVQELRERMPRRLVVKPAEPSGRGSEVILETI